MRPVPPLIDAAAIVFRGRGGVCSWSFRVGKAMAKKKKTHVRVSGASAPGKKANVEKLIENTLIVSSMIDPAGLSLNPGMIQPPKKKKRT